LTVQKWVADVDVLKRQCVDIGNGRFNKIKQRALPADDLLFAFITTFSAWICKCIGTTLDVVLITLVWMALIALDFVGMVFSNTYI